MSSSISISTCKKIDQNPETPDHNNVTNESFLTKRAKLCQFREMVLKNKLTNKYYEVVGNTNTIFTIFNKNKLEENCNSGHSVLL